MPLIAGIDQPVRDFLADLPLQAAQAGICMVCDPRGIPDNVTGDRLAYIVQPSSTTAFMLWRIDLDSRALNACAAPPAAAGGAYNTAIMAALFDFNGGNLSDTPTVYVMVSLTAAPWVQWMAYNIRTDAWAILALPTTGPAGATALGTSVSLCHPCTTLGVSQILGTGEEFIYANGDAGQWGAAGPSRIAQYNKGTNVWAYLTGAGAPRAAAPAAGSKSIWTPEYPGWIFCTRGGAAVTNVLWDPYEFAANGWIPAVTPVPAITLGEGSELCMLWLAPGMILVRPAGHVNQLMRICAGEVLAGAAVYHEVAQIDDSRLPAAHASNALIAWWARGNYYIGAIPYGRSQIRRIHVPSPV